jgi:protein-tyrosine phosphatase
VPIDGAPRAFDPRTLTLQEVYETVLTRHQGDLGRIVRAVASADGPVVVHCTAGKDRTGLVVALVLTVLELDRDIILADYSATAANLSGEWTERMLRKMRRFRVPMTDNLLEVLSGSPVAALSGAFEWLDREHGGALAYLREAGVDDAVREQLRDVLIQRTG